MTYPPPPGGYGQQHDPYRQHGPQPGYGQQQPYDPTQAPPVLGPDPYGSPVTGVPASPAYGPSSGVPASPAYGQPGYGQQMHGQPVYGTGPVQPPGERPQKVTLAAMLTMGMAAVALFIMLVMIIGESTMRSNIERHFSADEAEALYLSWMGYPNLLWVIALSVIAVFLLRGFNGARIAAFIVHGVNIGCAALVMIGAGLMTAVVAALETELQATGDSAYDVIPGWFFPSLTILGVIQIILPIVVIVLLANRQSSQWFTANTQARQAGLI